MQPILYLAITFALVCLYQLSLTWKVNNVDKAASQYALSQIDVNFNKEISDLDSIVADSTQRIIDSQNIKEYYTNNRDIILKDLEKEYIQKESMCHPHIQD